MLRVCRLGFAVGMIGLVCAGCVSRSDYDRVTSNERQLSRELVAAKSDRDAARQQCQKLNARVGELQGQVAQTTASSADLEKKLTELQEKVSAAQQKLGKATADLAAARKDQAELATARQKLAELQKSAADSEKQLAVLKAQSDAQAAELASFRKRATTATEPVGNAGE